MWSRRQITYGILALIGAAPTLSSSIAAAVEPPPKSKLAALVQRQRELRARNMKLLDDGKVDEYFELREQSRSNLFEIANTPADTFEDVLAKASQTAWCGSDLAPAMPESPHDAIVKSVWRDLLRLSNTSIDEMEDEDEDSPIS